MIQPEFWNHFLIQENCIPYSLCLNQIPLQFLKVLMRANRTGRVFACIPALPGASDEGRVRDLGLQLGIARFFLSKVRSILS